MLKLNIMRAATTFTHRGRGRKPRQNYSVKSPKSTSATDTSEYHAGCKHAPLTHGSTSEPIPTSRLALPSVIYPQAHPQLQSQAVPSSFMWSILVCPSLVYLVSQGALNRYRGCWEPDCSYWQAVMQLAASRRVTATNMLGPATMQLQSQPTWYSQLYTTPGAEGTQPWHLPGWQIVIAQLLLLIHRSTGHLWNLFKSHNYWGHQLALGHYTKRIRAINVEFCGDHFFLCATVRRTWRHLYNLQRRYPFSLSYVPWPAFNPQGPLAMAQRIGW